MLCNLSPILSSPIYFIVIMLYFFFILGNEFVKYKATVKARVPEGNSTITDFFNDSSARKYDTNDWHFREILMSLVRDMVVDCALPLSIVEKPGFNRFMLVLDKKFPGISRYVNEIICWLYSQVSDC